MLTEKKGYFINESQGLLVTKTLLGTLKIIHYGHFLHKNEQLYDICFLGHLKLGIWAYFWIIFKLFQPKIVKYWDVIWELPPFLFNTKLEVRVRGIRDLKLKSNYNFKTKLQ